MIAINNLEIGSLFVSDSIETLLREGIKIVKNEYWEDKIFVNEIKENKVILETLESEVMYTFTKNMFGVIKCERFDFISDDTTIKYIRGCE